MGPEGGSRGHRIYIFILQFLQEYIPDGTKEMIELQGLACVINVIPIGIEKSHRKFMQIHYLR